MKLACSYSGGKDCTLAIYKALQEGNEVVCLITTSNENRRSWFHDIDSNLLKDLSNKMQIPLEYIIVKEGEDYTKKYEEGLIMLKDKYQLEGIIFGDIDLQGHFDWTKERCDNTNLKAINPLWLMPRRDVVTSFLDAGFKAKIKKVNKKYLDSSILGKDLDYQMINFFEEHNIDACGENGEFHTIVYDGPIFKVPLLINKFNIRENEVTYTMDIIDYE